MLPRLLSCGLLQVDGASTICTVDHIHGSISATLCNLLQVGPGADEAQTRAVGRREGSVSDDFFLLHTEIDCTDRESYSNQIFYRTVLELYHRYCKCWFYSSWLIGQINMFLKPFFCKEVIQYQVPDQLSCTNHRIKS